MSEKKKRTRYSPEFKTEALKRCKDDSDLRVSQELGIPLVTLKSWIAKAKRSPMEKGKPSYEELEKELKKLKKEIGYVKDINEVLKKSTAIFASKNMEDFR